MTNLGLIYKALVAIDQLLTNSLGGSGIFLSNEFAQPNQIIESLLGELEFHLFWWV